MRRAISPPARRWDLQPGSDRGIYSDWVKDGFPRMIAVTLQHPTPYFDDSYAVNSVNVGPYGDAILQELIPEIEKRFRIIRQPWARLLDGGSTGGWEALALQIFHPDFFGGVWSYCPDSVDFSDIEGIDVYQDKNAFYKEIDWRHEPTINSREVNGQVRQTSEQRNHFELVNGTHGRSGEQLDIWSAVFGPLGEDGYFDPLFDKKTGVINPEVAQYWKEHYDLRYYMEKNWYSLGPKLQGKLHVFVGDADNFFLNNAVHLMQNWMMTTKDPHYEGFFVYGAMRGHCYQVPEPWPTGSAKWRNSCWGRCRRRPSPNGGVDSTKARRSFGHYPSDGIYNHSDEAYTPVKRSNGNGSPRCARSADCIGCSSLRLAGVSQLGPWPSSRTSRPAITSLVLLAWGARSAPQVG